MSDWPIRTIAECADDEPYATQIGPFGKALTPEAYQPTGVPLLRGVNVNHGRFHDDDFVFISEADADRLAKFESFPGDVLLVHKGTLGKIGLMPTKRRFARYIMGNSMLRVRCHPERLIPEYLYYWLTSAAGIQYLFSRVSQVGVPQIQRPLSTLREAQLPVPPLEEQRAIAGMLGALDDKIEQNRRAARALERLARAIFRAWFVDFEPVKAKAAGATAFPSMPQPVFDTMPARFVESAIGPVPAGWQVGPLDALVAERKERVEASTVTESLPYVPIDCIAARQIFLGEFKDGAQAKTSLIKFYRGDILFGAMRPYFHKVCVAPFDGTTRTTCFVLEPRRLHDRSFSLMLASDSSTIDFATSHSVGSTIPYAKWDGSLASMLCVLATPEVRAAYGAIAERMIDLGIAGENESRMLTTTRDFLLPKVLSGAVRVEHAHG